MKRKLIDWFCAHPKWVGWLYLKVCALYMKAHSWKYRLDGRWQKQQTPEILHTASLLSAVNAVNWEYTSPPIRAQAAKVESPPAAGADGLKQKGDSKAEKPNA